MILRLLTYRFTSGFNCGYSPQPSVNTGSYIMNKRWLPPSGLGRVVNDIGSKRSNLLKADSESRRLCKGQGSLLRESWGSLLHNDLHQGEDGIVSASKLNTGRFLQCCSLHKGIMGNVLQCCHLLFYYFKCRDASPPTGAERSPLLSSDESECNSLTPADEDTEDDMLTVSTDLTIPALEPEHFLYPDLILSSNPGGEVSIVEPMVCLLVSEEEEGLVGDTRMDEARDEGNAMWRNRVYSEVEMQTEMEIVMGVETQTEMNVEVQTQTERVMCNQVRSKRERHTEIIIDVMEKVDFLEDCKATKHLEKEDVAQSFSSDVLDDVQLSMDIDIKLEEPNKYFPSPEFKLISDKDIVLKLEQNPFADCPSEDIDGHNNLNIQENVIDEKELNGDILVEQGMVAVQGNAEVTCSNGSNYPVILDQRVTLTDHINVESRSLDNQMDSIQNPVLKGNNNSTLSCVMDLETALLQCKKESASDTKQMTLFLVDKLFLEAPHIKVPIHQIEVEFEKEKHVDEQSEEMKQSIQDIVDLQEMSFPIKIQHAGADTFEIQVSAQMLVAELHQVLMDHELTCHRTCFSLQLGGAVLNNLTELGSLQSLQEGAVIKIVEGSYSVRDARLHLRHVRNLLRSLDPTDAYNGLNGSSLSYLNFITQREKDGQCSEDRKRHQESLQCLPPEYVLPGSKDRPLAPLQPGREDWKPLQCLRILTMSNWNPPPGNRKMHGDLLYLNVLTIEDKELNITASTRGFYINQSNAFNFNPKPAVPKVLCHSLVELLSQVSPAFRKNFITLQKKRVQQHPYERIATPFQTFTWIAPQGDHILDGVRAEETHPSSMGQDEHISGQSRDWNEELQASRELPRDSIQERLLRERSIFKTTADFTAAATRGAVAVVDGNVVPLNPGEPPHLQMFIWNNIFFSLGFDISEHYSPLGGNAAAHTAAVRDLRGAQAYASVDIKGLHTLGTVVVDYRGVRVLAQTIVPGLLEKTQEQPLVYGSNDYGKTVFTHPRFLELLDQTCRPLKILRHKVLDHSDTPVELCSGIETKGIFGNDGRAYILDLLQAFPPDLNFQMAGTENKPDEVLPKECVQFGFPCQNCHRLANVRPELIEAFIQHRYEIYTVSIELRKTENCKKQEVAADSTDLAENKNGVCDNENLLRQGMNMRALRSEGSVNDSCFDIRFNPDVCSPGVRFPQECAEEVQRQKQLLWDAAAFVLSHQIPAVLRDCLDHATVVMDGSTLTSELHRHGVNVRYLGTFLKELHTMGECERLCYVKRIAVSEVIVRSTKHIFRNYLQEVEPASFSAAVSHFLNCFLGSSSCFFPECASDELLTRRRSRRRRSRVSLLPESVLSKLNPSDLWSRIRKEAEEYYHYTIESGSTDEVIQKYGLQRISLLREIAIKTGIQVQLREYVLESQHRPIFVEEDIVNMFPVVKHLNPTSTDASRLVQEAQNAVQRGLLKDGFDLISQAMTLFSSMCGVLHEDVCSCLRLLGRLNYILGDYREATNHQEKTVITSERVHGIDHPQTIQDYTYLALYCFAGGLHSISLQLLYRARYLSLLVCGKDHPQIVLIDSMLGLVLHGLMKYDLSQRFLENALCLASKYYGAMSLKHAQSHHLLAILLESKGDFRSALQHEKEACSIYKHQVGEDHDRTMESTEYLKRLTQQAVNLQKTLNQIYSNTPSASIQPPELPVPNVATILQQLNLTCGIILIPLSSKEVANLRTKFKGESKNQMEELEKKTWSNWSKNIKHLQIKYSNNFIRWLQKNVFWST